MFHPANLPFQCMSHPVRPEKKNLLFFFFFLFPEWYVTNVGFCGQELRLDGASRPSDAAREIAWVSFSLGHSNYPPLDGIAFSTEPAIAPCQPSNGSAQCRRDGSLLVTGAWRMTNQAKSPPPPHTHETNGRGGTVLPRPSAFRQGTWSQRSGHARARRSFYHGFSPRTREGGGGDPSVFWSRAL